MRHYHVPPYRRRLKHIADLIRVERPGWEPGGGFCRGCARQYGARLDERREIADTILTALERLPSLEKKVFVFYHYRALKTPEIAGKLSIDAEQVRRALARATRMLQEQLHPFVRADRQGGDAAGEGNEPA